MKRLILPIILALALSGCKCGAERSAVVRVEETHSKISAKLLQYVAKDSTLDAAAKDDWKKLVESDARNIESLKKALD